MNYIPDELIEKYLFNDEEIDDDTIDDIVNDIIYLEKRSNGFGILKDYPPDVLFELKKDELILAHHWQVYCFSIYFFNRVGMLPEHYDIYSNIDKKND